MSEGHSLLGLGTDDLHTIEQYLVEEVIRRVKQVEECERKIEVAERVLQKAVNHEIARGIIRPAGNQTRDDLYRDRYKKDTDWHNLSGTLRWHMALCDMYSGAAAAVQLRLRRLVQQRQPVQ